MTAVTTRKSMSPTWQAGSLQVLLMSQPKAMPAPAITTSLMTVPPGTIMARAKARGRGETGNVVVEEEDVEDDDGDGAEDGTGHERAPEVDVASDQLGRHAHARRDLVRRGGERERVDELVPRQREGEERRAHESGHRDGQDDAPQCLDARGAVHHRALLDLLGHGAEVADEQPGAERNEKGRVREHERPLRIAQPQPGDDLSQRQEEKR